MLTLALASPPYIGNIGGALPWVERYIREAASAGADIVCFPECFIPGLRGPELTVQDHDPAGLRAAREQVCAWAAAAGIGVVLPMDWDGPDGILNVAFVISAAGEVLGCQEKIQIAPEEDAFYVPGNGRTLFEIKGYKFGIAICHEGWRYPETVRWAATRGAKLVFHPNMAGGLQKGQKVSEWGAPDSPYYEKAMVCRSLENAIFFASVNYALPYPEAATALIGPDGDCITHAPYGEPSLLIGGIDPDSASSLYAERFAPERY